MSIISTLFATLSLSFLLLSFPIPSLSAKCNPQDKRALKQIEKAIAIPPYFQSWTNDTDCCEWHQVGCDEFSGRVIELRIQDGSVVSGEIPDAIADLPYLKGLLFASCPNLTGSIPKSITKLKDLIGLRLTNNSLSGPIPSFLSELKNLDHIDLSFNKFSGPIPASISELPMLRHITLDGNKLTGSIPESLGKLSLLSSITIAQNQLTGTVPKSFANIMFELLDFSSNNLKGDISFLFGQEKTLRDADFSRNLFEFDMSKLEFTNNMFTMDLSHNKIFGSLPEGLTELMVLEKFNVSYNRLCGKIPTGGRMQSYDKTAYLHNRCLCGAPLADCK